MCDIDVHLLEHRHNHRLLLHEERGEEVKRRYLIVPALDSELVRPVDGFFGFCRVVVEWCHTKKTSARPNVPFGTGGASSPRIQEYFIFSRALLSCGRLFDTFVFLHKDRSGHEPTLTGRARHGGAYTEQHAFRIHERTPTHNEVGRYIRVYDRVFTFAALDESRHETVGDTRN